ncbi:probable serine/threonine-protein kinase clkA [Crassostrea angulata]|uniref:probable serine/threonine-protein kinase clkA n=1 Tax=Magallana angulata TaxID=2784310 RepID=UPI0022B17140|nr:probable serine/threonine-protein kinase clkA [Crassostrea angulata]
MCLHLQGGKPNGGRKNRKQKKGINRKPERAHINHQETHFRPRYSCDVEISLVRGASYVLHNNYKAATNPYSTMSGGNSFCKSHNGYNNDDYDTNDNTGDYTKDDFNHNQDAYRNNANNNSYDNNSTFDYDNAYDINNVFDNNDAYENNIAYDNTDNYYNYDVCYN